MKKTSLVLAMSLIALAGVAHAETLRAITVEQNASYALDTDSIVQSNGKTAFAVQTIYTSKMSAPNNAPYNKAVNTFLADCKAKTIALTGVKLMDGSGNVVFTDTPTVEQAPVMKPEPNSLSAKIMQAGCSQK
jgi:hypothetical protein